MNPKVNARIEGGLEGSAQVSHRRTAARMMAGDISRDDDGEWCLRRASVRVFEAQAGWTWTTGQQLVLNCAVSS